MTRTFPEGALDTLALVREFHAAFSRPTRDVPTMAAKDAIRRAALIGEEAGEFAAAALRSDLAAALDALIDLQYVIDGAFLEMGLGELKRRAFLAVHLANMAKLWPDGSARLTEHGKIVKPPGWVAPDLRDLLSSVP